MPEEETLGQNETEGTSAGARAAGSIRAGTREDEVRSRLRERELERMRRDSAGKPDGSAAGVRNPVGLAFSGGGIRSATYCLGVMQALAQHGWMRHFDYLSTVSGGGYIGAALSWLLGQRTADPPHGTRPEDFPFNTEFGLTGFSGSTRAKPGLPLNLQWLRHRGNYLTPGHGHNWASFVWTVLRGVSLSAFVYLGVLTLALWILRRAGLLDEGNPVALAYQIERAPLLLIGAALLALTLGGIVVLYGLATGASWFLSPETAHQARDGRRRDVALYRVRRVVEKLGGGLLVLILAGVVVGTLPFVSAALSRLQGITGLVSLVAGVLTSLRTFQRSEGRSRARRIALPIGILASAAAALVTYGLLLLGYWLSAPERGVWALWGAAGALLVGLVSDLNLVSIHRFYRDRLMEAFLPNPELNSSAATQAEVARLSHYGARRPYHIINTNVVLVDSRDSRYRDRGGDGFILSPEFCGSSATGWIPTKDFLDGNLTLATAMAISGAAAHPNTGVAGEGPTRGRLVSLLMTFFNIRLGVWVPNPRRQNHFLEKVPQPPPNFFNPGVLSLARGPWLNERRKWIELTDGGHFENLGIYELIRRRCRVILACDAGADPDFRFADLANAVERVRADFGVLIEFPGKGLDALVPQEREKVPHRYGERPKYASRGFLIGEIRYPVEEDGSVQQRTNGRDSGVLIYLKTTVLQKLTSDIYGYSAAHPSFPDESTVDQFFSERQFEAYRELGFKMTYQMLECFRVGNCGGGAEEESQVSSQLGKEESRLLERAIAVLEDNASGSRPLWSRPAP